MGKPDLNGNVLLNLGKQEFVKLMQKQGGLGKWVAGKLYGQIKDFKFDHTEKQ